MTSLQERVSRKLLKMRNTLIPPKQDDIHKLLSMMDRSPNTHAGAQAWAHDVAGIIETSLLDRLHKRDLAMILAGLLSYRNTGVTPQDSQIALMRAYENSSGVMQDLLHKILFFEMPTAPAAVSSPLLGDYAVDEIDGFLAELDREGYVVLPNLLSSDKVDTMIAEARKLDYALRDAAPEEKTEPVRKIDPASPPKCVAAYARSADVAANSVFSAVRQDPLLTTIAGRYLHADARAIDSTLWYSFSAQQASAEAAQMFHYDLDTLRWIKVFFYLTDVGPENGPHEYVPGSHKAGSKPAELLLREYARLTDEEIDRSCPAGRRAVTGKRGTVIIGDTRCLHKGTNVHEGYRLIFSPIFAPSRIGYFHGA